MIRLFVGIVPPEPVRDRLAMLCSGLPNARWTPPENLHVTLRFIGDVGEHVAEDVHDRLAAVRQKAFEISLAGVGTFGSRRQARLLWAGVVRSEPLEHLRDKVESAVVRAGLEPEGRKFKPHVTLARLKEAPGPRLGAFIEANDVFAAGPFPIDRFILFRSDPTKNGSHYSVIEEYPLLSAE